MRRRALMAASMPSEQGITITPDMTRDEIVSLVNFFVSKYGDPYGTKTNPLPIDENVYVQGFYISDCTVNRIRINSNSVQFRNDTLWGYNCVRAWYNNSYEGISEFMWD
ncbi:MAG: hypothetical protein IKU94_05240 [Bacteroidaceae bacterium]|nr:hypothetical protein [Bacteroidaceae bacterium]